MCAKRAQSRKERRARIIFRTSNFRSDILVTFGLNTSEDIDGVHPDKICSSCRGVIRTYKSAKDLNNYVQYKAGAQDLNAWFWKPFESSISAEDCVTCKRHTDLAKNGGDGLINKPRMGAPSTRPPLTFDPTSPNIFSGLTSDSPIVQMNNYQIIGMTETQVKSLTCSICSLLFPPQSVIITCNHMS